MKISDVFLPEYDVEMQKTRKMLERVPEGKGDYRPHEKSMPLARLAGHVAELPGHAIWIAKLPELDVATAGRKPVLMESRKQLLAIFDETSQNARKAVAGLSDDEWQQNWKLLAHGKTIIEGQRFFVYREMCINHIVHHRTQLGVYLRLNDVPLPAMYGPSADDRMGL